MYRHVHLLCIGMYAACTLERGRCPDSFACPDKGKAGQAKLDRQVDRVQASTRRVRVLVLHAYSSTYDGHATRPRKGASLRGPGMAQLETGV